MKKQINLVKITIFVLLLTVTALVLVAGTYAKYTSSASGTDATVVAEWSFMVENQDITILGSNEEVVFDLFNTINDITTGEKETNVADGLIAPGTTGDFEFKLKNTSDVTTQYVINLSVDNTNIPLEFSLGNDTWFSITDLSDLVATDVMAIDSEKNVTVKWRWAFGENESTPTSLGGQTIKVTVNITATQVNYKYVNKLQEKYELSYYGNLTDAIAEVNNNTLGENNIDNIDDAEAAIYTDNGVTHVVLLKDIVVPTAIKTTTDMVIDLGGNTLSSETGTAIAGDSGNLHIDGRTAGSTVKVNATGDVSARAITVNTSCNLTIEGGTYISNSESGMAMVLLVRGTVDVIDATLIASSETSSRTDGISLNSGGNANVVRSDITAINESQKAYGIYVSKSCEVTITDSDIKGYANYNHNGSSYTASSMGIYHSADSTLTLNNSHVIGTIAGIQTYGTLYVDGGTIEGYGHGGIYFQGTNATSYIKNATIQESDMIDGFTNNTGSNHVGFYVGGNSGNIYMDNCDIISSGHSLVLRSTSGEKNNNLYISNSRIPEGSEIRIDNNGHKLYNGVGNNFTLNDTTLPDAVIDTDVDYSTLFPEF